MDGCIGCTGCTECTECTDCTDCADRSTAHPCVAGDAAARRPAQGGALPQGFLERRQATLDPEPAQRGARRAQPQLRCAQALDHPARVGLLWLLRALPPLLHLPAPPVRAVPGAGRLAAQRHGRESAQPARVGAGAAHAAHLPSNPALPPS
eukprot:3386549-Prymnesium_polylepis.1